MKANELRVGNYHKTEPTNIPRLGITGSDYSSITAYGIYLLDSNKLSVEPIPLTEEWLVRFGFKKDKALHWEDQVVWLLPKYTHKDNVDFWEFTLGDYPETNPNCGILRARNKKHDINSFNKNEEPEIITIEAHAYNIAHYIKYVNQLQNLYFALTGKELK